MTLDGIAGVVPARFVMPLFPAKYDQIVFVNWLEMQVPAKKPMPVLDALSHWRNREVFNYVRSYDWTAIMFQDPIRLTNVRWP